MELTCPSRRSASARPITSTPQKTSQSPVTFAAKQGVITPIRSSASSPPRIVPNAPSSTHSSNEQSDPDVTLPMLNTSFNDSWPQSLTSDSDQRIAELEKELALVDSGQHPKYLAKLKEFQRKQEDELEMIEIMYEREKEEIERKYQLEHEAIQKELAERQEELVQTMLQEVDERIRFIEAEVAVLDVAGPACPTFSMNKKSLRRRPHDTPTSTEKKRARMAAPPIIHLLPEHIIAEDVKLLAPAETIPAVVQHHKVSIENGKLIYEGKTFQRGQALVVQTLNYGAFAGMILNICGQYIQFRSTVPGDTRQVMATMDDLESGRVILKKKVV